MGATDNKKICPRHLLFSIVDPELFQVLNIGGNMKLFKKGSSTSGQIKLTVKGEKIFIEALGNNRLDVVGSSDGNFVKTARKELNYIVINHKEHKEVLAIDIQLYDYKNHSEGNYYCILEIPEDLKEVKDHLEIFMPESKTIFLSRDFLSLVVDGKEYLWHVSKETLLYKSVLKKAIANGAVIVDNPDKLLEFAVDKINEKDLKKFISEPTLVERFEAIQKQNENLENGYQILFERENFLQKFVANLSRISKKSIGTRFQEMKQLLKNFPGEFEEKRKILEKEWKKR